MTILAVEFKKIKVIKKGRFVLTGGKISNFYVDIKKVFGYPMVSELVCDELCKIVDKTATCIASIGYGGLPLASMVSLKLGLPPVVVREKPKKHGLKNLIDGYISTEKDRVVVVDDVFTTGTSILKIIKSLSKTKAKILGGYVVVNRGDHENFTIPIRSLLNVNQLTG